MHQEADEAHSDVRLSPNSGAKADIMALPLRANMRLCS
jgi:hypothetical protein